MTETNDEKKMNLKLMVDVKLNKVMFAEANKEFVDFVFELMSLPLSTITRVLLLNEKGTVGSLGALYKSIESLDPQCFGHGINNGCVLNPRALVTIPLLSLNDVPPSEFFFKCPCCYGDLQLTGPDLVAEVTSDGLLRRRTDVKRRKKTAGYVNGGAVYMVMDNLEVKPMSIELIKSHVEAFDVFEEMHVEVGLQEGLTILKASLQTDAVLTVKFHFGPGPHPR